MHVSGGVCFVFIEQIDASSRAIAIGYISEDALKTMPDFKLNFWTLPALPARIFVYTGAP